MKSISVAIVVFPASNREQDVAAAVRHTMNVEPIFVRSSESELPQVDLTILPGGFAWGDYLRAGAIAAREPIVQAVRRSHDLGGHVLGICNGFQVLTEAQMLPGVLTRSDKYQCRHVHLRTETVQSAFTCGYNAGDKTFIPIAHQEGSYHADADTLKVLEEENRVAFRYVNSQGQADESGNPNGSLNNIAGILDPTHRILGLMPHFENACLPHQHSQDGLSLFHGLKAWIGGE